MKQAPHIWRLDNLIGWCNSTRSFDEKTGIWVPARPFGFFPLRHRLKAAWLVFTGKADALLWKWGDK